VTNTAYIRSHRPVPGPAPAIGNPRFARGFEPSTAHVKKTLETTELGRVGMSPDACTRHLTFDLGGTLSY
jgi:hypothetical protein